MGCCLSSNQTTKPDNKTCGGAPPVTPPPPPPQEEEAVKEVVLSETPTLRVPTPREDRVLKQKRSPEIQELKVDPMAQIEPKESTAWIKPKELTAPMKSSAEDFISEVSEQSELCSFTESFSTTTTLTATAPEKRDDGEEVTQRSPLKPRRKRPNNGDMVKARERNVRSPARGTAPSPEKRKPVRGRGMTGPRRNLGPTNGPRRDGGGDASAWRSRSPVTRRNSRNKSPAGRAGDRSPPRPVEIGGGKSEVKKDVVPAEISKAKKQNDSISGEIGESLENPLVSLECFIFL